MSFDPSRSYGLSTQYQIEPAQAIEPVAPPRPTSTPGVWFMYAAYCGFMALIYMLFTIGGALVALNPADFAANSTNVEGMTVPQVEMLGWIICGLSFIMGAAHAIGIVSKSGTGSWVLGIVLIAFGLTSLCTLPFAIFMMIGWLKQSTRDYFRTA